MSAMPPPQPAGPIPQHPDPQHLGPHTGHLPLPPPPTRSSMGSAGPMGATGLPGLATTVRAGQLTPGWRTTYLVTWVGVVLVYASVWRTARTMGLSTWWLGPSSDPQFVVVQLLPFVGPLLAVIAAGRNLRFLPHLGIAAGLMGLGVALVDVGEFSRLAVLQSTAAGAGLLASIASIAGLVRRATSTD